MVKVYTSYFSKAVKNFNPEMQYIVVSNSIPKWWPDNLPVIWLKEFAPDWQYVEQLKNGLIEWQEFVIQYKQTLLSRFGTLRDAQAHMLNAIYLNGNRNVSPESIVLLCYEKDSKHCHRSLLVNLLLEAEYKGELQ